ncbi:MAG: FAD-binding oxidoreductase [Firmicutes bacterium]|nr:FAD-binding oxidoreductase [Bacillota bacterium]
MPSVQRTISGWGRFLRAECNLYRPERVAELSEIVKSGQQAKWIPRGCGRSYGDAALNGGHGVILLERLDRFLSFEPSTGLLRCEAGVRLADIIAYFLPRGWFLPVTPGTKFCSIGACVACDVHGKNHHRDGSLAYFVKEISLLLPEGKLVRCSPQENPDLFRATAGGMGLTGIILDVEIYLRPVESAYITVDYVRTRNLDETLSTFQERDSRYLYSVGWLDCLAERQSFGRGVLMFGKHSKQEELPPSLAEKPLQTQRERPVGVPFDFPGFVLNKPSLKAFNLFYYRAHKTGNRLIVDYDKFFYPLDKILHWNRIYGKKGFLQYQCVLPFDTGPDAVVRILQNIKKAGALPFLAVLKRMGAHSGGLLSFPVPGYTLALDFPVREGIFQALAGLDQIVLAAGGRVYLAKDACLRADVFKAMYPDADRWREIKASVDPQGVFSSDLARRLELVR